MSADLLHELPPAQRLALSYAPSSARPKTAALFALECRLAGIVRTAREPMLAQLRLAWWRDRLTSPQAGWPSGDAVLDALRQWNEPAGLAEAVNAWEALLAEQLSDGAIEAHIAGRAAGFALLARELGAGQLSGIIGAARCYVRADLAANLADAGEREAVCRLATPCALPVLPRSLRPLAILAGLGRSALQKGGSPLRSGPGSVFLALRIGLTGR